MKNFRNYRNQAPYSVKYKVNGISVLMPFTLLQSTPLTVTASSHRISKSDGVEAGVCNPFCSLGSKTLTLIPGG